ncbi:MAG: hypothetical protein MJ179_07185 [Treponema sp.]|nr:hypothetical protein [Treponema sp.]
MTDAQWNAFETFKKEFWQKVQEWTIKGSCLPPLQQKSACDCGVPFYNIENPVVYNTALDKIKKEDDIRLIVIGDNPGKSEQLNANKAYLVGQAGKIAEGYFRRNPELGVDFRKNAIILNKTPVHSAKTNNLKQMTKEGGKAVADLLEETQIWMAQKTASLLCDLINAAESEEQKPELWLVGYSELRNKGLFLQYRDYLKEACLKAGGQTWDRVYVFQHFSMNCFTKDLANCIKNGTVNTSGLKNQFHQLGKIHKQEIFG